MTVKDLVYSTSHELKITLVSYVKVYNSTIELKFNSHAIKYYEYIMMCDVRDWRIESDLSITIWTGDDILIKLSEIYRDWKGDVKC